MKTIQEVRKKRFFQVTMLLSVVFLVLSAVLPWWQLYPEIGEEIAVPLHYNIHFGVDLFGPPWRLFVFPISGALILLVNLIAGLLLWRRDHVLSYFLFTTTAIASIIIFVAMVFVTLLNLSYA